MGDGIPLTLATVHRLLDLDKSSFISFVVCPSCDSIYEYSDCIQLGSDGKQESKLCTHVGFPNHPQSSRRTPCGALLLKKVRTKKGFVLAPIKVYPYKSLRESIEHLAKRNGFLASCEKWRDRTSYDGYFSDIFDGAVWRKFNDSNDGYKFLTSPHCYLLTEPQLMKKFCNNQAIYGLDLTELCSAFPHCFKNTGTFMNNELPDSLNLLHYAVDKLNEIESFAYASGRGISTCPPFYEDVFSAELVEELKGIYKQLYPSREIENISCFFRKFGRIILANDLIGSVMPGSNS